MKLGGKPSGDFVKQVFVLRQLYEHSMLLTLGASTSCRLLKCHDLSVLNDSISSSRTMRNLQRGSDQFRRDVDFSEDVVLASNHLFQVALWELVEEDSAEVDEPGCFRALDILPSVGCGSVPDPCLKFQQFVEDFSLPLLVLLYMPMRQH